MINLKKHIELLGKRVECTVTGAKGVVTSITFDLYGCIQALVNPGVDKTGKPQDSHWFDVTRLRITSDKPVMARPEFEWTPEAVSNGRKGPSEKPAAMKP